MAEAPAMDRAKPRGPGGDAGLGTAPEARKPEAPTRRPEPSARDSARGTAGPPRAEGTAPKRKRRRLRPVLFALLPLALAVGGYEYVTGGQVVSTDDAYVNTEKVGVSTDVSGIVAEVDVTDNQHVVAGQILYRLDPRQFRIALDNAEANLAETALNLDSMKQDYRRMLSDVAAQQAKVDLDRTNTDRDAPLVRMGAVSHATYDQARYTLQSDASQLEARRRQAAVQLAKLDGNPDRPTTELPQYLQVEAQVAEAQRELDHAVVRAPFAGTVTRVSSIAPGANLAASTTAFYLVDTDHVWVDAVPKETQLTYVRPGQPVTVTVDTYPDLGWRGTVESIEPAAAQEFQLLPAQNTSGNWVKVVQRIPMRVRVDTGDKSRPPLRAGMSVEVGIDTGHARGLPHFLATLLGGAGRRGS